MTIVGNDHHDVIDGGGDDDDGDYYGEGGGRDALTFKLQEFALASHTDSQASTHYRSNTTRSLRSVAKKILIKYFFLW